MSGNENIVTVACVNFAASVGNKNANMKKLQEFVVKASSSGVNIMVFPETTLSGYFFPLNDVDKLAETIPGSSTTQIAELAAKYDMYIIFGMIERDTKQIDVFYNSAAIIGPSGIIGTYRKVHPPAWELQWCIKGSEYPVFETRFGLIGVGICYDNYCFPEVARTYALKGARLLIHPTAFPEFEDVPLKDYREFYKTMLGARCVENQIFIASANLTGKEGNSNFFGHSAIFGPKPGAMNYHIYAGPAGIKEEMVIAKLDLDVVKQMPSPVKTIQQDRRPDTYDTLIACVNEVPK